MFYDKPTERELGLFAPESRYYDRAELEAIKEAFAKEQVNDPETIKQCVIGMDKEIGSLVVGMVVNGDHTALHQKANSWLTIVRHGDSKDTAGYMWRIGH